MARKDEGGVLCPYCGYDFCVVIDTYGVKQPDVTFTVKKRRRKCKRCHKRFNTLEIYEDLVHDWYDKAHFEDRINAARKRTD
jgi:transcriptional regulator NrdR family protein